MKTLSFIRHAIARDKALGGEDFLRPLTDHGRKKFLKKLIQQQESLTSIDMIISSPATRCKQTTALLCSIIDLAPEDIVYEKIIYNTGKEYQALLSLVQSLPDDKQHIALVGHNSSLSLLVSHLLNRDIHMKKGDILTLNFSSWGAFPLQ